MLPDVGIDDEICIQGALELMNVDLGLLDCHIIPLLVSILIPPVGLFIQLLDRGQHPYISTGISGNHF